MNLNLRKNKMIFVICSFFFMFMCFKSVYAVDENETILIEQLVRYDKVWKVSFNNTVNKKDIKKYIKVINSNNQVLNIDIKLNNDGNQILIYPPNEGYKIDKIYTLIVDKEIESEDGKKLSKGKKVVFKIEGTPEINFLKLDHSPVLEGEPVKIIVASNADRPVQYFAEIISKKNGNKVPLLGGYSEEIDGRKPYIFSYNEGLPEGKYKLKVYLKRANSNGINTIDNIDFDECEELEFFVEKKKEYSLAGEIQFGTKEIKELQDRYYLKIGKEIIINGIKGMENINGGQVLFSLNAYNSSIIKEYKNIDNNSEKIIWKPEFSGEYILELFIKDLEGNKLSKLVCVTVDNKQINYVDYNISTREFAERELEESHAIIYGKNRWRNANVDEIQFYLDPDNLINNDNIYQFLVLNYAEGMTIKNANEILKNRGILDSKGKAVLEGAKKYNINPAYLMAHMLLETGNGTSVLANGVKVTKVEGKPVEPKMVYNMYGIQAVDSDPIGVGSEYAYKHGWFTPEKAIIEGAKWIGEKYINSDRFNQNTLYKMRWNKDVIWHQYATDVEWARKQVERIKKYIELCPRLNLIFEIPKFKKLPY